jgi:iron complex transport system ATP-binding protein
LLSAHEVGYTYARGGDAEAVREVSVELPPGGALGILGPNGSGKTTLLRLLGGLLRPTSGHVRLDGEALSRWPRPALARRIAMVPQETHPAFDYSVLEMVLMGRYPHLGAFEVEGPEDLRIAREALAATGVTALERRPFTSLSGGEKQRVVIASALAQRAEILLLDEPTASLDPGYQLAIAALVGNLHRTRGIRIALATHDLNLAAGLCDRLLLLKEGRAIADGPTRDVLTPEHIARLYNVDAEVTYHERAERLTVVPIRRSRS